MKNRLMIAALMVLATLNTFAAGLTVYLLRSIFGR